MSMFPWVMKTHEAKPKAPGPVFPNCKQKQFVNNELVSRLQGQVQALYRAEESVNRKWRDRLCCSGEVGHNELLKLLSGNG